MSCCWCCCGRSTPRCASFCTSTLTSSFWVASNSSMLTGACGGGGCGSLRDVNCGILIGSGSHHLSSVTYIIRYCNNPVEYDVSYVGGKYNMEDLTIVFTKVISISIHQLSSYRIYKRCCLTFVQVAEYNLPIKNKRSTRTLFSGHELHPRLEAIILLVSPTYPLKITKCQTILHPDMSHNILLIDIRHGVRLNGCCGCRWHLKL
jgi:hypothetical protein